MRNSKFDFTKCCLEYMEDLFDMIDDLDEELSNTKAEYQQLDARFNAVDELYHKLKEENEELRKSNESYQKALRSANTLVDHQSDIINEVRQLIIDNIVISADADGCEETSIIMYPSDVDKIFELLNISEEDYTEC